MKEILLTQNKIAIVDDDDYEELSKHKWFANKIGNKWYACRAARIDNHKFTILMHREIMLIKDSSILIDHIDGDGLNNTKSNLRLCNKSENARNRKQQKNNKSGYKGVSWSNTYNKWEAKITVDKKHIFVGYFTDVVEAAKAIDRAAIEYHGEFCNLNFAIGTDDKRI